MLFSLYSFINALFDKDFNTSHIKAPKDGMLME